MNDSIFESFSYREELISMIGSQLSYTRKFEVRIGKDKIKVDYRIISLNELGQSAYPVVLLSGFGSGWEGIIELGFSLACEGRKVILVSLPGYGNSDNPSEWYYNAPDFRNEAEVLFHLINQEDLRGYLKFHLVGHSMGGVILQKFARMNADKISSITLLNPPVIWKREAPFRLAKRFVLSGFHAAIEFWWRLKRSDKKDYEKGLYDFIRKPKSPFSFDRLKQRISEINRISNIGWFVFRGTLNALGRAGVPTTFVYSELDSVYPHREQPKDFYSEQKVNVSVMTGLRHNTTLAPDEITAANIEHYLELAEK